MDYNQIETLVISAKQNDNDAKKQILEAFKPFIYNLCKNNFVQGYSFEDLLQECYMTILKAINLYNCESKTFAKYCTVSIRNAINMLIRKNAKYNTNTDLTIVNAVSFDCEIALDKICNDELKTNINTALDKLKINEKAVILHSIYEKKPMNLFFNRAGFKYKKSAIKKLQVLLREENHRA